MFAFALALLATAPDAPVVDAGVAAVPAVPPPIAPREPADGAAETEMPAASIPGLVLSARVEPDPVPFGGAFDLVITLTRDRGKPLALPQAIPDVEGAPRTGPPVRSVEDLPPPPAPPAVDGGPTGPAPAPPPARVRETVRIPFLALDTQGLKTPAFPLAGADGASVDVAALAVRVEIPQEAKDQDARDLKNPAGPDAGPLPPGAVVLAPAAPSIAYAVRDARPFVVLGAFASSGALYALVRFAARRRRALLPQAPPAPPPPPRPAHEVALERLEALLASGLLQRGETAVFVERLMDEVLRDYLTARFALSAGTRTTRELVQDLLGIAVAGLDVTLVEGLLADADLVKFAKASIPAERAHAMATRVRTLVEATRVIIVAADGVRA